MRNSTVDLLLWYHHHGLYYTDTDADADAAAIKSNKQKQTRRLLTAQRAHNKTKANKSYTRSDDDGNIYIDI